GKTADAFTSSTRAHSLETAAETRSGVACEATSVATRRNARCSCASDPPRPASRLYPLQVPLRPTQSMSDCVVSVRTLANSSPRTKSVTWARSSIDVEEGDLEGLAGTLRHAHGGRGELRQAFARRLAGPQRLLVGPERDHERLSALAIREPDESAKSRAVTKPREQLIPDDHEAGIVLLRSRLQRMHAGEHDSVLHCSHAICASADHRV